MTRAAQSILVFGIYVVGMGVVLMARPSIAVAPLGLPAPEGPWVRVLGLVAFVLGYYYLQAARQNVTPFFRWTLWGRSMVFTGFVLLAVVDLIPAPLIVYGVIDGIGAVWTGLTLRAGLERQPDGPA